MKKLTIQESETLAQKFRSDIGLSMTEPISVKTVLRQLGILALYRPLSNDSFGISAKSASGKRFMMINSNSTRGRQHFTIAHELYHLYYDEKPIPHMCTESVSVSEKNANLFASALLMPREGLLKMMSKQEIIKKQVELATVIRLEQLFSVSRNTLLVRLKEVGFINEKCFSEINAIPVKESARQFGYEMSLYEGGNEGLIIGDFGEKAWTLFENGKISEGHYIELLNMITHEHES